MMWLMAGKGFAGKRGRLLARRLGMVVDRVLQAAGNFGGLQGGARK
jgi:hypothetical protein